MGILAPIMAKFGKKGAALNILLTVKVDNFRGSFEEFRPKNMKKLSNKLENAKTNKIDSSMSTNPLVENYDIVNATYIWYTCVC